MSAVAVMAAAGFLAAPLLRASPLYLMRYAFTNAVNANSAGAFSPRAVAGLNNDGEVCGTFMETNGSAIVNSVFLMEPNGVVEDLFPAGTTPAVHDAFANGMTQRGADGVLRILGSVQQADGFRRGAIWTVSSNDTFSVLVLTNLVLPTNSLAPGEQGFGEAVAMNASGLVVGDGNSYHAAVGLEWAPPYTEAPGKWGWGDGTYALAVNDQGQVLVNGALTPDPSGLNVQPGLVSGAGLLKLPLASTNFPEAEGTAMSGPRVIGRAVFGPNTYQAPFVWTNGDAVLTPLPAPGGMKLTANGGEADSVNASGDIVGYLESSNDYGYGDYKILWKNEGRAYQPYVLNRLFVAQPGLTNIVPHGYQAYDIAINDRDDIALHYYGFNQDTDARWEAVRVYQPVTNGVVQFTSNQSSYASSSGASMAFVGLRSDGAVVASVILDRADGYSGPVSVHYTTLDGGALAGRDYVAQSGTVSWKADESGVKNISIQAITNNYIYLESFRTFSLRLDDATGAELGMTNASMEISGDDWETLQFTNLSQVDGEYDVQAGASNVVLTLKRAFSVNGTMVVTNITTYDSSAVAGVDYQGMTNTTPVTWGPGEDASLSLSIPLLDSNTLASPRYFTVHAEGAIDGTNQVEDWATVGILPPAQTPVFQFDTSGPLTRSNLLDLVSFVEQGRTVVIQSSTNLLDWMTVAHIYSTNGVVHFDPSLLDAAKARFYRAAVQ